LMGSGRWIEVRDRNAGIGREGGGVWAERRDTEAEASKVKRFFCLHFILFRSRDRENGK
jgi:hypothetical protein